MSTEEAFSAVKGTMCPENAPVERFQRGRAKPMGACSSRKKALTDMAAKE